MGKKRAKRGLGPIPWETLPSYIKDEVTKEEWDRRRAEEARREAEYEAARKLKRANWVEPSMTLEEADADPFCWQVSDAMRTLGVTVITRSDFLGTDPGKVPRGWTDENENNIPPQLQDPGWS